MPVKRKNFYFVEKNFLTIGKARPISKAWKRKENKMILVVCSDNYGYSSNHEFETIAQAQDWIALNHHDYEITSVYTSLTFEIVTKVTICEDVNIF